MRSWPAIALAALTMVAPALAEDDVDTCIDASTQAQAQQDAGQLIAARAGFLRCAAETCPKLIRKDCAAWHGEVDALVPSIVPRAADDDGKDLTDVVIEIDDMKIPMDGQPFELDPGKHELTWRWQGETKNETIVVRAGEKSRLVDVTFASSSEEAPVPDPPRAQPAPSSAPEPPDRGIEIPIASWVLLGGAVTGGVLFAVFASEAVRRHDELNDTCAPTCTASEVDPIERDLIIANVAAGIGAAALGAAVIVAIVANVGDEPAGAAALPLQVGVGPSGADLTWRVRF